MKPTLGWWLHAAEQIGAKRAERAGVDFLGAIASPYAACVEQRFMVRGDDYSEDQHLVILLSQNANPRRPFDQAGERLDEWISTLPVLALLEPMARGL